MPRAPWRRLRDGGHTSSGSLLHARSVEALECAAPDMGAAVQTSSCSLKSDLRARASRVPVKLMMMMMMMKMMMMMMMMMMFFSPFAQLTR